MFLSYIPVDLHLCCWICCCVFEGKKIFWSLNAAVVVVIAMKCKMYFFKIIIITFKESCCICFQNKYYPRDSAKDAMCRGRVRVQLKNSDNSFVSEKFQSSKNVIPIFDRIFL